MCSSRVQSKMFSIQCYLKYFWLFSTEIKFLPQYRVSVSHPTWLSNMLTSFLHYLENSRPFRGSYMLTGLMKGQILWPVPLVAESLSAPLDTRGPSLQWHLTKVTNKERAATKCHTLSDMMAVMTTHKLGRNQVSFIPLLVVLFVFPRQVEAQVPRTVRLSTRQKYIQKDRETRILRDVKQTYEHPVFHLLFSKNETPIFQQLLCTIISQAMLTFKTLRS